jgi:hypothetical protein
MQAARSLPTRSLSVAFLVALFTLDAGSCQPPAAPPGGSPARSRPAQVAVRGWTILSDSEPGAREVIAAARGYGINQLGLSQRMISRLNDLRDDKTRGLVNRVMDAAHQAGIPEVIIWDNPIYTLDYYPEKFRTGPGRSIDLDNPEFWRWFKADYRALLDLVPAVNGILLTYMESQGQIVNQTSKKLSDPQKLAALVNAVADVVIGERHLALYARVYPNDRTDNPLIAEMVGLFAPQVRLQIKLTPLDYLLTVPNTPFIGALPRATVVEFVPAAEFAGQGIVANTWVEDTLQRWRRFARSPQVIGYSARTDRFMESRIIGKPGEIDLLALQRGAENPDVTAEQVYDEFITKHYGAAALPEVKLAFKNAFDYATSTFYTLGTVLGNHSMLDFEYTPPFIEMCAGRWFDPPIAQVRHGVDREFHYWRDVMDRLAPPFVKDPAYKLDTIRSVELAAGAVGLSAPTHKAVYYPTDAMASRHWLRPGEAMDEEYLRYIVTEKDHAVALAQDSLAHIEKARPLLTPASSEQLYHYFNRSLLTARLWRATTSAYFGFRVWSRGGDHQSPTVRDIVQKGLAEIKTVAPLVRSYPVKPPTAQFNWSGEADNSERYFRWIVQDGWPRESQAGIVNPNAGMKFPYQERAQAPAREAGRDKSRHGLHLRHH